VERRKERVRKMKEEGRRKKRRGGCVLPKRGKSVL
jgi:hypothetical protein